jgi:hypothetical protein
MENFNVAFIQPEGYPHSLALAEAAEYIFWGLIACGHHATLRKNQFVADAHNVVVCGHMLTGSDIDAVPANAILFNSEQIQNKAGWQFKSGYGTLIERCYVWDYSLKNLSEITHDRKTFLPFLFCPQLVRVPAARAEPGQTLYFYGAWTDRRIKLIEEIKAAGVPVEMLFNVYTGERDAKTRNAWAILNLRSKDHITTFEPLRCTYALNNGVPVITEAAPADPTFAVYEDYVFAFETDALVDNIVKLHRDPAAFNRASADKMAAFQKTSGAEAVKTAVDDYLRTVR